MSSYVASWGIIGCGWISSMFVKDLCVEREDSTEISHSIVAVGSRDLKKAQIFVDEFCPKGSTAQARNPGLPKPAAFGSYEEVFNHKDVDIIYIGTLNSGHYSDAKAALLAGKNVLVEKPACLNAAEWRDLTGIAVEKKLFLMEGVWTRFLPLAYELQSQLFEKRVIGDIKHVQANFSMAFYNNVPDSHRNFALETAGGVMYDLGPYTVLCALLALYHHPDNSRSKPDKVFGNMVKARTGVDLSTTISMEFPKLEATALLTASFAYNSPKDERCVIIGTQGEIVLNDGLSRITKMTIKRYDQEPTFRPTRWQENEVIEKPLPGFGLMFEADAVAKSIRNEELQNSRMPHDETAMVLEIFDQVRQQNGYTLPDGVEEISK
uniref:D-xylose 1-dehydrogenase (NADP(+), D-xylono-1,5-lactone-forming) n=1 Tax=Kwoniella bestiolae CBS 10118 TaxID=1296100 RepID=A0A1B9GBV6_9TREE|nr:hypothetical protein I302_03362 [Kwoniella bestiolae CBS 10118]OCF28503.1 hypothetical protein I302_03362 [Kwoniella bestiolae CBS 10118]